MARLVRAALEEVGASPALLENRQLPFFSDATELTVAHVSANGREHLLAPAAAQQWKQMRAGAERDGVVLLMISRSNPWGYRYEPWYWCYADG
jgi:D-alanyl-D-alanine carboxypeptidase